MNTAMACFGRRVYLHIATTLLAFLLIFQPACLLVADAQGRAQRGAKKQAMTEDQRLSHLLSRLTFGARPGDLERVKAMGVDAFIKQQLEPDAIDDGALL